MTSEPLQQPARLSEPDLALTLFVSGASTSSARAIRHVQALCDEHLHGRYRLTVVNVHTEPGLARTHRVYATPTLIRESPLPERRVVGDFSDPVRVLNALHVRVLNGPGEAVADRG